MSKTCSSNITESVIKCCPVSRASFLRAYQRPSHYSLVRARIMDKPETLNQITMGADQHAPAFSASPRSLSLYGQIYTRALKGVVELTRASFRRAAYPTQNCLPQLPGLAGLCKWAGSRIHW